MTMLGVGLNKIRDLHAANMDVGECGTSGTVVDESQTGLQTPVAASSQAITVVSTDKTNTYTYNLLSTTATGNTFREFNVQLDGDTEYNRHVFTGVEHTANDDIIIKGGFFYRNP